MRVLESLPLEGHGVRLEPLGAEHEAGLRAAVADGRLWELWYAAVPEPDQMAAYIADALRAQREGHALPWAVRDLATDTIIGTTRYHDVESHINRVHIGYTWYGKRWQRTHVNTTCKLLLMTHAFEAIGADVVALRTDRLNFASRRAIAGLGAQQDGILRHHQARRDGSVRDSVVFSILAGEWPDVKRHLTTRVGRLREQAAAAAPLSKPEAKRLS